MSMDEFIQLITEGQIVDENFGSREIGILYNLAMFTQVDEIDEDRHMKMFLDEFMDALGRVADRLCVQSPYDTEKLDKLVLAEQPTHKKLKALIEILLKNTMKKEFIELAEKKILIDCKVGIEYDFFSRTRKASLAEKTGNSACSNKGQ